MSDHPLSDDELLSSALDGDLDASERAALEGRMATDPALRERHDRLHAAQELVAAPVAPLADTDADRMIAAALAASATAANVTDLATAASRRRVWSTRVATAAAAVVALALAVPAIRAIDTGGDSDTADAGDEASFDAALADDGDSDTAGDLALESSPADHDAPSSALAPDNTVQADSDDTGGEVAAATYSDVLLFRDDAGFDPLEDDLGDFGSTVELSRAVSQIWSGTPATDTTTTGDPVTTPDGGESANIARAEFLAAVRSLLEPSSVDVCDDFADLIIEYFSATGDEVTAADYGRATTAGAPRIVGVFRVSGDEAVLLIVDPADCTLEDARLDR